VTVFEKNDRVGGLLRYGIPDFKMEKHLINRRMVQMEAEGVSFRTSVEVGVTVSVASLKENFDAIVLAGGAEDPRPLHIPGFELPGVRFAMEFLTQQNKRNAGDDEIRAAPRGSLTATGKHVVVIGGGDTGSDCVGFEPSGRALGHPAGNHAQAARKEDKALSWPNWPLKLRTSSSHEEGVERDFAVLTKRCRRERRDWSGMRPRRWVDGKMQEVPGSEFTLKADLIFLPWALSAPQAGPARTGGREAGRARQCRGKHRQLSDQRRKRVLVRGHASRSEPGRLGHPRRSPVRPRGGRGADGRFRTPR
jgi:glutamate synthase (NADPH/NADH) small chain